MKYLFVHDHILRKFKNEYYSTGGLSNNVMHRYLYNKDDSITLYTRYIDINDNKIDDKLIRVDDDFVKCVPSKYYHSPKDLYKKKKIFKEEIKKLVSECDMAIIRIPSFLGYFVYDEVKRQNKKYVLEVVACPWDSFYNHSSIVGKIMAPFMYFKMKKACKGASNSIYVSNEFLQKRYPTKGNSIACSNVNLLEIDEKVLEKRLKKINKKTKIFKIGLIGSLNVNFKGHYEAIRLAQLLKKDNYKVEIHFLGAGKKEKWQNLANKYNVSEIIYFDGTLPNGEPVLNWLDEMDIYIIPSLQEGLPRALIEAMSRACPSVGMKTGGIPELLDGKYVCHRKKYYELYEKVKYLLDNKQEMEKEAKRNFAVSKGYLKKDLDSRRKKFIRGIIEK